VIGLDAALAACFVLAATVQAVAVHRGTPGLLVFAIAGAPVLAVLGVRRSRPVTTIVAIAGFAVLGTVVQAVAWPEVDDSGGVWMLSLMVACYSLGAHARGRVLALGCLLPLLVVLVADVPGMHSWELVSGVVFVTTFIGVLPTVVGRVVQARHERLAELAEQRDRILDAHREQLESVVLAERLRTTERLGPALLDGLRDLARRADSGAEPAEIETAARDLLGRTRAEVVALTAPIEVTPDVAPPAADHVRVLRLTAQPWAAVAAGAVTVGLAAESAGTLHLTAPPWVTVLAAVTVGAPVALVWWRPVAAIAATWCAATAFSRLVAPLDGTLSETALALTAAFAVGALCSRRAATLGLVVCWLGQLVGVGTGDPFGEGVVLLACWAGGLALNEVSRLVEQSRTNNRLLARQEAAAAQRAVVDERLRLARELHDQVGHTLTVVALQAGAARRIGATDPARAGEVLQTIATVARDGATGLGACPDSTDLAALVARTRDAGLVVDVDLADADLLGPDQRSLVFRVVQEALTNVLRHAPGSRATVSVRRDHDAVVVEVANTAPTGRRAGPGTGRGLAGIRDRVVAAAGSVSWAPRADGGFEVHALLPVAGPNGVSP
jgi:signal transduction histidine kinase